MYETIQFEEQEDIARITLLRERINMRMVRELTQVCDHLEDTSECKVVVIQGNNGHFSYGIDFEEFRPDQPMDIHGFNKWEKLCVRIERLPKVTIAAMEGGLRQNRAEGIAVGLGDEKQSLAQTLEFLVRESGPKCPARSATANFQHTTLQTQMLPNYREFLLWLSTQPPSFLYAGKEEWAKVRIFP